MASLPHEPEDRAVSGGRRWLHRVAVVLLFSLTTAASVRAQNAPRYVLVLTSFEQQFSPHNIFNAAFRAELTQRTQEPIQFVDVSLPSISQHQRRRNEPEATLEYVRTTFALHRPDLIVTVGGVAALFAQRYRQQLPEAPILFASVDQRFVQNYALKRNEAAVTVSIDPRLIIENILQVQPRIKTLAIVNGASELETAWRKSITEAFAPYAGRVKFVWLDELSFEQVLKRVTTLPAESAILFAHLGIDAQGIPQVEERALQQLYGLATVPIFGVFRTQLGEGIVGGPLLDVNEHGRNAAGVAVRILRGEPANALTTAPQLLGPPAYDNHQLERWAISDALLPAGSTILFRPPTAWERYRTQIIIAGVVGIVETALLVGMLTLHLKRKRADRLRLESESRFRLLADTAPVMIWMADADGRCTDFNRAWLQFTGRPRDQELGDGWTTVIHPDDRDGCLRAYRGAFERREPFRIEYRLLRADGEYRWVLHAGAPRLTSNGAFVGCTGSVVDISEHRMATAALSTLSRRLMQAQEEERTRIARELHDDICQRVAAFTMQLAQVMRRVAPDHTDVRNAVADLSRRSKDLGSDIQALSHRLHSSKLQLLGLSGAAASFCRELAGRHGVTINYRDHDVPSQLPDETSIGLFRVMQEALMNAVKHSSATQVDVALEGQGQAVRLEVSDRGVGFNVDDERHQHGLGLVSMRERVSLIGGELVVQSRPGDGTTVSARVPIATPVATASPAPASSVSASA